MMAHIFMVDQRSTNCFQASTKESLAYEVLLIKADDRLLREGGLKASVDHRIGLSVLVCFPSFLSQKQPKSLRDCRRYLGSGWRSKHAFS